jgi:hypothetical protein
MITQEILDSFVYETLNGEFEVTDPTEFDQILVAGPFKTKKAAEAAFLEFVEKNSIEFE